VSRSMRTILAAAITGLASLVPLAQAEAVVPDATHCQTSGTWRQGELNVYWFDVEQGDGQLIVGPPARPC